MRTIISSDPYSDLIPRQQWTSRGDWPCFWVGVTNAPKAGPFVAAYRLRFNVEQGTKVRIHVTADERYDLHLDGVRLGRGSERGDVNYWFYETFDLELTPGEHVFVAKTWWQGDHAPLAQMSLRHGFLLAAEGPLHETLSTGVAAWEGAVLKGFEFLGSGMTWGAGTKVQIDGATYPWAIESGSDAGYAKVATLYRAVNGFAKVEIPATHRLRPATLPAQIEQRVTHWRVRHVDATTPEATEKTPVLAAKSIALEVAAWQKLVNGVSTVTFPANTSRRIILDFEDYQCVYPVMVLGGGTGARVRMHWAEGLYEGTEGVLSDGGAANARGKANRDVVENRCFLGVGDVFLPSGPKPRRFETLWWSAGRYVEISIVTADEALTIEALSFDETRYPLSMEGSIGGSDSRWDAVTSLSVRTLQNCAHETYMDCPYYEQLQYMGDTRLQALVSYVMTEDDRLPRKALLMGFASINNDRGVTTSRYPSRSAQLIPPFSMWWVSMLFDHSLWRGDKAMIRRLIPGTRLVLDKFLQLRDERGLMRAPDGWNFTDWVPEWAKTTNDYRNWGIPPHGDFGFSSVLNWHLVYTLNHAAQLEEWLGEPELASRYRRNAGELAKQLDEHFWDSKRKLYADDLAHQHFSEHAQCLALLSGFLPAERKESLAEALFSDPDLARATIYFSHYLFEAAAATGRISNLFRAMEKTWFPLPAMGLKALPEEPEPCRSDCHAWGAHPLYHYYASVLGIRPSGLGDSRWIIKPQLGALEFAQGVLPHPSGAVQVDFRQEEGGLRSEIVLPKGVMGVLVAEGKESRI